MESLDNRKAKRSHHVLTLSYPSIQEGAAVVESQPATDLDSPLGFATLNGYVLFPVDTPVTYYFEYSTDCSFQSDISATPLVTIMATGSEQPVPPQTISGLSGSYCYRLLALGGLSSDDLVKKLELIRARDPLAAQRDLFDWIYGTYQQFQIPGIDDSSSSGGGDGSKKSDSPSSKTQSVSGSSRGNEDEDLPSPQAMMETEATTIAGEADATTPSIEEEGHETSSTKSQRRMYRRVGPNGP